MNKIRSLVLIADDAPSYRETTIPNLLRTMKGVQVDIIMAKDVHETIRQVLEHGPNSPNPLDLIVLDMHMPPEAAIALPEPTAGVWALNVISSSRLSSPHCPIVIFSAYPSFNDCFLAAQAGASAYITKLAQELPEKKTEGGPAEFVRVCQKLLSPEEKGKPHGKPTALSNEWLKLNHEWLRKNFGGRWASFVFKKVAEKASLTDRTKYPERDGVVVLLGDCYEEVQALVLSAPALYRDVPPIIKVPGVEQTGEEVKI